MTLYELYNPGGEQEIELAPEIERILWRHLFRINDSFDTDSWESKDRDRRVLLALALKRLHQFTVRRHRKGELDGAVPVARNLAGSLGEEIDQALNSDDVEVASRKLGDKVRQAVKALARAEGKIPDLRTNKTLPAAAALILEAREQFTKLQGKPSRQMLQAAMEARGYTYSGNDASGKWKELFMKAGLSRWYSR
jgi:hypothetical protein